jgi:hypothetical protein
LKEEGGEFLFARCFLTLEWNLMARSESIVTANFFHITWEDDSLVFRFAKSKSDQTGRNTKDVGSTVRLYEAVRPYFAYPSKTSARREEHISWYTVYNLYVKHDKKFAVDLC